VAGVSESARHHLRSLAAAATIGLDRAGEAHGNPDAFLTHAATAGLQARAGWRPATHPGRLPPAPNADRPLAPNAARATLRRLLDIGDPDLIEEWACLAGALGVRADGAFVPVVLEWWARQPRRSPVVFEMLGQTGAWLAALNPEWRKPVATIAVPEDVDEIWNAGRTPERIAALVSVRRADPARARRLIESTWTQDGASERKAFLEVLFDHRSLADEPFLEAALDDRSKQVRRQAATVLAALPGSRLRQRMTDRAATIIGVPQASRGLLGRKRPQVTLTPPLQFDSTWDRDGVEERPPSGVGPRAWWMRQILAATDLTLWEERTSLQPDDVVAALQESEFLGDALLALVDAASRAGSAPWSLALARRLVTSTPLDLATLSALLRGLSDLEQERVCLEVAAQPQLGILERWAVFTLIDAEWSPDFSHQALALVPRQPLREPRDLFALTRAADTVSRHIAPRAADVFEDTLAGLTDGSPSDSLSRSIERVRLRADMHKEFTS
jgi:hypothetical protein